MRILYVASWYPTMNDTFVIREIAEVVRAGHSVTICVLRPGRPMTSAKAVKMERVNISQVSVSPSDFIRSILIRVFNKPKAFLKCFIEALFACIRQPSRAHHLLYILFAVTWFSSKQTNADARYIHAHFLHTGAIASRWLSIMLDIPYGITAHISKIRFDKRLIKKVVKGASICVGDTLETVALLGSLGNAGAILIRNGIDTQAIAYREPATLHSNTAPPIILGVGTLIPPKGFHVLIDACNILRREGIRFVCRIVGEGVERENLERIGHELIQTRQLDMPGSMPIDELMLQYRHASLLVMPSVPSDYGRDGLPTVIIEAMAHGVPVIGTNHAAIPELVRHKETGLLVSPCDASALAEAVKDLLDNPDLCKELSLRARQVVESEFDIKKSSGRLLSLISYLCLKEGKPCERTRAIKL